MKALILSLAAMAVASAIPAPNEELHWISPINERSPNVKEEPFVELAQQVLSPKRPRFGKAVSGCGISTPNKTESRISNGVEATPHEFPWQVILTHGTTFCSGSLISDEWVLTAAHCTTGAAKFEVVMGAHSRLIPEPESVTMTSTTWIVHEGWNEALLENDVALVKLPQPVTLSYAIRPICLPTLSDPDIGEGVMLIMSGWGTAHTGGLHSITLRKVSNPSILNAECAAYYGEYIHDSTICTATLPGNQGTCMGDYGGPLMLDNGGIFYSRGITSFLPSRGCESGLPDGFMRTKYYLNWINTNTGIEIDP